MLKGDGGAVRAHVAQASLRLLHLLFLSLKY